MPELNPAQIGAPFFMAVASCCNLGGLPDRLFPFAVTSARAFHPH